jgi:hypothetical protein
MNNNEGFALAMTYLSFCLLDDNNGQFFDQSLLTSKAD